MTGIARTTRQLLCCGGILFLVLFLVGYTSAQTCNEPPTGLVGWWSGDGNADDIVSDNHGTLMNGATFGSGKVGQAFSFDGNRTYVKVESSMDLDLTGEFTIDAWINPNPGYGSAQNIYDHIDIVGRWGPVGSGLASYLLAVNPGGRVYVMTHNGATTDVLTSNTIIPVDTWSHVAGVRENATLKIYINGVLDSYVLNGSVAPQVSNLPLTIGQENEDCATCDNPGGNNFDGLIDEVEIFNRALSQGEISAIFNAGSAGKCKLQTIAIDIKPGSYPNCFNVNGHGVIPVAILGSQDFDVEDISMGTLSFNGLQVRVRGKKGPLCSIDDSNGDQFLDLVCHFEDEPDEWVQGSNESATVTGELIDATPFEGTDSICIVP